MLQEYQDLNSNFSILETFVNYFFNSSIFTHMNMHFNQRKLDHFIYQITI